MRTGEHCIQERGSVKVDPSFCPEYPDKKILLWYQKSTVRKLYEDSKRYCDNKGWRLFGEYDGTKAQTDWLYYETRAQSMYLGIERLADHKRWINFKGEDKTSIVKKKFVNVDIKTKTRRVILMKNNQIYSHPGDVAYRNFICVRKD